MPAEARHYRALDLVRWERPPVAAPAALADSEPGLNPSPVNRPAAENPVRHRPEATGAPRRAEPSAPPPAAESPGSVGQAEDERIAGMGWDELRAELARRSRPPATRGVFGVGAEDAPLFVIGEAPGADEDRLGEPFVGRAGKLLDAMLGAIGHDRKQNVYIANICKFRPPDNRDPRPEEVRADLPLLLRQIALVQPRLLLAVGRIAAQTLLHCETPIGKLRGRLHTHEASGLPLLVTYHPAYLLRSPPQKARSWEDLKQVLRYLR